MSNSMQFKKRCIICTVNYFLLLLYITGDVEIKPSPIAASKYKNIKACHVNNRGLNDRRLQVTKISLCNVYDIIIISETFLSRCIICAVNYFVIIIHCWRH